MTVYVDSPRHRLGRMTMCHMVADTLEELHAMAVALGVHKHFQNKVGRNGVAAPHYDICKANRRRAVALGAIEVSSRQLLTRAWASAGGTR